jgi:hypothetical protein
MKRLLLVILIFGCAHYSTIEADNQISAPVDVVWSRTLEVLKSENVRIQSINKESWYIEGQKPISLMSNLDIVHIQLVPKGQQTLFICDIKAGAQLIGWGHQEKLAKDIFNKVKTLSELK